LKLKRIFDLFFAIVLSIICFPLGIFIYCMIIISMGCPGVFIQSRPGLNAKTFKLYKFRTMKNISNSEGKLIEDNKRTTKLGKFLRKTSLDELPSLFNVMIGNMSFVGPRPLLIQYLQHYSDEQAKRHDIKPGITGWAQINGRNEIDWQRKFALDVWYVDNRTFYLDIKILVITIKRVLTFDGINALGDQPVKEFIGNYKEN